MGVIKFKDRISAILRWQQRLVTQQLAVNTFAFRCQCGFIRGLIAHIFVFDFRGCWVNVWSILEPWITQGSKPALGRFQNFCIFFFAKKLAKTTLTLHSHLLGRVLGGFIFYFDCLSVLGSEFLPRIFVSFCWDNRARSLRSSEWGLRSRRLVGWSRTRTSHTDTHPHTCATPLALTLSLALARVQRRSSNR